MNLDPLFNEFKSILQQELDYELEANFQKKYQERAQVLSSKSGFNYRVPTVIDEISSQKVLGMSFESGVILRKWAQNKPSRESRNAIATAVLNLYVHEFFSWGMVQTDPNWGNFLIEEKDGLLNLCVLDFGATRTYSREFIQNYICLLDAVASGDSKRIRDLAISSQLIDSRENESAFHSFERLLINSITPFFQNGKVVTSFNFADRRHIEVSQAAIRELSQELVFSPPPYSLVFLHRKLAGVYSILKVLEIEMNVAPYWERMKELAYSKS
jgi:aarF domain-containing kinase